MQREALQERRKALLDQKKVFETKITRLIVDQKKAIAKMSQSNKQQVNKMRNAAEERSRLDRTLFDQEFTRLKNSYQTSLAQIKDSYSRQNIAYFNELKQLIGNCIEDGRTNYQTLVENNQAQIQELHNWLHQELPRHLIEIAAADNDMVRERDPIPETEEDRLAREISSRDELIQRAEGRIKELEEKISSKQNKTIWNRMRRASPTEPYKEEEPKDPQQEVLNMIREIAQEREQMERVRDASGNAGPAQLADSFGSRMSKKLIH
jgi:hypothetical protein